jgi:Fe-S-cluster containining protein
MLPARKMPRVPLPLPVLRSAGPLVECTECALCCTYVAVGINAPTTPRLATDVLWYLYHEHVYVYVDEDGEWSVVFETRCRNLDAERLCGVYADRPHICRGFDNRTCEVNAPAQGDLTFREPAEFLGWLRQRRPRLLARVEQGYVPPGLRSESGPPRPAGPRAARRRRT